MERFVFQVGGVNLVIQGPHDSITLGLDFLKRGLCAVKERLRLAGVIFLDIKNGTDFVTGEILELAHGSTSAYLGITLAIGIAFSIPFVLLARGQVFRPRKFIQMAIEGTVYATVLGLGVPYDFIVIVSGASWTTRGTVPVAARRPVSRSW